MVEADIVACAQLADELRMPSHQWVATTMRAMWALLQGSLDEAEALAEQARAAEPDGPNALFAYHDLLEVLRWDQGRLRELRPVWQEQMAKSPWFLWARLWTAMTDADLGSDATARRSIGYVADELAGRPRDGLWPPAVAVAALAAGGSRSRLPPTASTRPWRRTGPRSSSSPCPIRWCFGSASLYLGLLGTVTRRWAEADDHFEAATAAHQRLEAGPLLARTRYEHARMLLARGQAGDRRRAEKAAGPGAGRRQRLGVAAVVEGIQALQSGEAPSEGPAADAAMPAVPATCSAGRASTGRSATRARWCGSRTPRACATWPGCSANRGGSST